LSANARLAVERRCEHALVRRRPERVFFAVSNAATNGPMFLSGHSAAGAMQPSLPSVNGAIFAIDKRRTGGLSSEKIFVAVCERLLARATEARTASEDGNPNDDPADNDRKLSLQRFGRYTSLWRRGSTVRIPRQSRGPLDVSRSKRLAGSLTQPRLVLVAEHLPQIPPNVFVERSCGREKFDPVSNIVR